MPPEAAITPDTAASEVRVLLRLALIDLGLPHGAGDSLSVDKVRHHQKVGILPRSHLSSAPTPSAILSQTRTYGRFGVFEIRSGPGGA